MLPDRLANGTPVNHQPESYRLRWLRIEVEVPVVAGDEARVLTEDEALASAEGEAPASIEDEVEPVLAVGEA